MKEFFKTNGQLVIVFLVLVFAGILAKETAFLLVPLTLIMLKYKNRYMEMIMVFSLLLCLADSRHHMFDFAKIIKDIALVILSLFVFIDSSQFKERSKLFMPFALFLLLSFVLSARHPDPLGSFQKILSYTLLLVAVPNYFLRELNIDGAFFMRNMVWFYVVILLFGLFLSLPMPEITYLQERYCGLLGNPNSIGTFCTLLVILITLTRHHYPGIFSRNQLYLMIGIILISVLLSRSRNCIFSILIFLFFTRFYKISHLYGFIIVIFIALIFQVINENLVYIINSLGLGTYLRVEQLEDGSGRLLAWNFAWQEIQNNFWIGRGFAYEEYLFKLNADMLSALGHQGGVHNTYLAIWLNTGLLGLILFLIGFFRIFFTAAIKNYLAIPVLFTLVFSINFEPWFQSSLNPFTIMALLIITLLQFTPHATEEKSIVPVL